MYCRNCGKEVAADTAFCPSCGAYPVSGKGSCPACGAQTNESTAVCLRCGTKLTSSSLAAAAGTPSAAPLPGVSAPLNWAWKLLWPNFWMLLLALLVNLAIGWTAGIIAGIPTMGFSFNAMFSGFGSSVFDSPEMTQMLFLNYVLSFIIQIFVLTPIDFGFALIFLKVTRKEKWDISELFNGFKVYWKAVGAGVLVSLIVIGGLILMIVPGIIFTCKLAFVPYLVIDRKMGAVEAISTSWQMTRGHAMEVFAIGLLSVLIVIAGFFCLFVGVFIAVLWIQLAMATLYYAVSAQQKGGTAAPVVPAV